MQILNKEHVDETYKAHLGHWPTHTHIIVYLIPVNKGKVVLRHDNPSIATV